MPQPDGRVGLSFAVSEWAELASGHRVVLHDGILGYTSVLNSDDDPWSFFDADGVIASVLSVVLPDEDDGEEHPWTWLLTFLSEQGIEATEAELRAVPYVVELGTEVLRRVNATPSSASPPPT